VNLFQQKVIACLYGPPRVVVKQSDDETGYREQRDEPSVRLPNIRGPIKRSEQERRGSAGQNPNYESDGGPAKKIGDR
jgi:hypothetical protein